MAEHEHQDLELRVNAVRAKRDEAATAKARLEGQQGELERQKKKIMKRFKDLGVKPKEAPTRLKELQNSIESKLEEAERVIAEYESADEA